MGNRLRTGNEHSSLNGPETGHGLPTLDANGVAIKNDGSPLGYTPVMSDATKATTFDDIGSEINVFDTTTNQFVYRYVDMGRDFSQLVVSGRRRRSRRIIPPRSGSSAAAALSRCLSVTTCSSSACCTQTRSKFSRSIRIRPMSRAYLTQAGFDFTGGITPEGVEVSPDGKTVYVANLQTEDVSFLGVDTNGRLTRQGYLAVGVTDKTPDPTKGNNGSKLFATDEEVGLRWFFSSAYADDPPIAGKTTTGFDPQKSCGFCHWDGRQDGCQWNVAANALGGVKVCPQNKDISDNWPEWYEGLNNDFMAYASACNGEVLGGERRPDRALPSGGPERTLHRSR